MADQGRREPADLARQWQANPESMQFAVGVVTAALNEEGDNDELLKGALRPMIEAGESTILQTFGAMTALTVRSINTLADAAQTTPQELWGLLAAEVTKERNEPPSDNGK